MTSWCLTIKILRLDKDNGFRFCTGRLAVLGELEITLDSDPNLDFRTNTLQRLPTRVGLTATISEPKVHDFTPVTVNGICHFPDH